MCLGDTVLFSYPPPPAIAFAKLNAAAAIIDTPSNSGVKVKAEVLEMVGGNSLLCGGRILTPHTHLYIPPLFPLPASSRIGTTEKKKSGNPPRNLLPPHPVLSIHTVYGIRYIFGQRRKQVWLQNIFLDHCRTLFAMERHSETATVRCFIYPFFFFPVLFFITAIFYGFTDFQFPISLSRSGQKFLTTCPVLRRRPS